MWVIVGVSIACTCHICEAPPPYGKRIVTIHIEIDGPDKASMIFAGRIYEYRDRFQECC